MKMDVVTEVIGGHFVQHVPVDIVVDLREREMEHAERMILVISLAIWKHTDCDVFALLSPRALAERTPRCTYGVGVCIKEPHVLPIVCPVLVAQVCHTGWISSKRLTRESSLFLLYRSVTQRFIGKRRELLSVT